MTVIAVADVPASNGVVYSAEELSAMADTLPESLVFNEVNQTLYANDDVDAHDILSNS